MKSYNNFLSEAISASRLAQLAAKGKGGAAAAKMKADNLTSSAVKARSTTTTKPKSLPGTGSSGGALVKRNPKTLPSGSGGAITKKTQPSMSGGSGGSLTRRPSAQQTGKGGAVVRANRTGKLDNRGVKKVDVKVDNSETQTTRPGTTRTTDTSVADNNNDTTTTQSVNQKKKKNKKKSGIKFPSIDKLETDDSTSTGSVSGLQYKNQD